MPVVARRLFVALCLFVLAIGAHAQTCTPPTIVQVAGSNPSCAGQPVTLDAGPGWATYTWSNGATTRLVTDTPSATTTYTVTVSDGAGCTVTSQPLQVQVTSNPAPTIDLRESTLCGSSEGQASGYGIGTRLWTISGGTFAPGVDPTATVVRYSADGTGPITL
jgi:hypothetical protein